jgi:hypothetical protein
MNKQTIINGADAEGRDTSGTITPMGKQKFYSGPMFERWKTNTTHENICQSSAESKTAAPLAAWPIWQSCWHAARLAAIRNREDFSVG